MAKHRCFFGLSLSSKQNYFLATLGQCMWILMSKYSFRSNHCTLYSYFTGQLSQAMMLSIISSYFWSNNTSSDFLSCDSHHSCVIKQANEHVWWFYPKADGDSHCSKCFNFLQPVMIEISNGSISITFKVHCRHHNEATHHFTSMIPSGKHCCIQSVYIMSL